MGSKSLVLVSIALAVLTANRPVSGQSCVTVLAGRTASSSTWASGWLDLANPLNLEKGETLRLTVAGSATKIVVRLHPKGADPDSTAGVVPVVLSVPMNRVVELIVPADSPNVVQISVHGGSNPWNQFLLGSGNGPATLLRAERVRAGGCD
jgi:hypothetical protein